MTLRVFHSRHGTEVRYVCQLCGRMWWRWLHDLRSGKERPPVHHCEANRDAA